MKSWIELVLYFTTTALVSLTIGWALSRHDRDSRSAVVFLSLLLACIWAYQVFVFTDNCGAGGGCEDFYELSGGKAMLVAGAPPLIVGAVSVLAFSLRRRLVARTATK